MPWEPFERAASRYEDWYLTGRGQRTGAAEQALIRWLLAQVPEVETAVDVGCGTGYFTAWLAGCGLRVVGVDRAPAMLAELVRRHPEVPAILADAHRLPFRPAAVDVVVFVTTLEFLEGPREALAEAVAVARRGILIVALNRWSLGGLSRRWGTQARRPLLGQARDVSIGTLTKWVREAAGPRLLRIRWASTLFPDGGWRRRARIPLGDVLGLAATLAPGPLADRPRVRCGG